MYLTDPAMADTAVSNGAFTVAVNQTASALAGAWAMCRANISSQIGVRGDTALTYQIVTHGWNDPRGRFS